MDSTPGKLGFLKRRQSEERELLEKEPAHQRFYRDDSGRIFHVPPLRQRLRELRLKSSVSLMRLQDSLFAMMLMLGAGMIALPFIILDELSGLALYLAVGLLVVTAILPYWASRTLAGHLTSRAYEQAMQRMLGGSAAVSMIDLEFKACAEEQLARLKPVRPVQERHGNSLTNISEAVCFEPLLVLIEQGQRPDAQTQLRCRLARTALNPLLGLLLLLPPLFIAVPALLGIIGWLGPGGMIGNLLQLAVVGAALALLLGFIMLDCLALFGRYGTTVALCDLLLWEGDEYAGLIDPARLRLNVRKLLEAE